jgi:hypothetical protein
MRSLAILLALLGAASAHMCLVSPPQRGAAWNYTMVSCARRALRAPGPIVAAYLCVAARQPANPACAWTDGPCGKTSMGAPTFVWTNGTPFQLVIQKNLVSVPVV